MSRKNNRDIKATILEFVADLRDSVFGPTEHNDLASVMMFFELADPSFIAQKVRSYVAPHTAQIRIRDENFFLENADQILGSLPADKVEKFKKLWVSGEIDASNKAIIFDYFDVLMDLLEI